MTPDQTFERLDQLKSRIDQLWKAWELSLSEGITRQIRPLAEDYNRLLESARESGMDIGDRRPVDVPLLPKGQISPLLELFAEGSVDVQDLYRPSARQKQKEASAGRICALGGGLD